MSGLERTYEKLLDTVNGLPSALAEERDVVWVGRERSIGAARSPRGQVELFIAGPRLVAEIPRVRASLEHHRYRGSDSADVEANRITLPSGPHFEPVAAFLMTELLRNGVGVSSQRALARTEPVIALALEQAAIEDQALVGLIGELLCLRYLMSAAPASKASAITDAWWGHDRSARDIQLGRLGIEVKATTAPTSTHHVQGFHQVEPGASVGGVIETRLRLLSVGIAWSANEVTEALCLPDLVDDICARIDAGGGSRAAFLGKVATYGTGPNGYKHDTMAHLDRFRQPFGVRFARLYDLSDPAIHLLNSQTAQEFSETVTATVSFDVRLPSVVDPCSNPVSGLPDIASALVALADL